MSAKDDAGLTAYVAVVAQAMAEYPRWRLGQAHFNVLADVRPDLSEQIRGTELDPFYQTARLPAFIDWLKANWAGVSLRGEGE